MLDSLGAHVAGGLANVYHAMGTAASTVYNRAASGVSSGFTRVRSDVTSTIDKIRRFLRTLVESVAGQLCTKYYHLISKFRLAIDFILDKIASTFDSFSQYFSSSFSTICGTTLSLAIIFLIKQYSKSSMLAFFLTTLVSVYLASQGNYITSAMSMVIGIIMNHQSSLINSSISVNVAPTTAIYQDCSWEDQINKEEDYWFDCNASWEQQVESEEVTYQADEEETETSFLSSLSINKDIKSWLFKTISIISIVSLGTVGLTFNASNVDTFLRRHTLLHKAVQSWESVFKYASDWITQTYTLVLKYFYGQEIIDPTRVQDVEDLYNEVLELCTLEAQQQVGRNHEMAVRVEQLYRKYLYLRRLYMDNRKAIELLSAVLPPLVNLYKRVIEKNPLNAQFRKEPVCVSIRGRPGVGKSYILQVMQRDLASILGKEDNFRDISMYMRCSEQEYWDGYAGQQICCFDDIGQRVDSVANPNIEFFELIRSVNIFPYMLHSAALHEKANNTFISDFVVLTTNLAQFNINSIISKDALQRRIHIDVDMSVIPEVRKDHSDQLDLNKLTAYRTANGLPPTDLSHVQFLQVEKIGETTRRRHLSYDQFIKLIEQQHEKHVKDFEERVRYGDSITPWSQRREDVQLPTYQIEDVQLGSYALEAGLQMRSETLQEFLQNPDATAFDPEYRVQFLSFETYMMLNREAREEVLNRDLDIGIPVEDSEGEYTEYYPIFRSIVRLLASYTEREIDQWRNEALQTIAEIRDQLESGDFRGTPATTLSRSSSEHDFFFREMTMEFPQPMITSEMMDQAEAGTINERAERSQMWHRRFVEHVNHIYGREPTDEEEMEFFQRYTIADNMNTLDETMRELMEARSRIDKIKESLKTAFYATVKWVYETTRKYLPLVLLALSGMAAVYAGAGWANKIKEERQAQRRTEALMKVAEQRLNEAEPPYKIIETFEAKASGQKERRPRKQYYEWTNLDPSAAEVMTRLGVKKTCLEGLTSEVGYNVAQSIRRNVYSLWVVETNGSGYNREQRLGQVCMIKGHIGIVNSHFINVLGTVMEMWVTEGAQCENIMMEFRALGAFTGTLQTVNKFLTSVKPIKKTNSDSDMNAFIAPRSLPLAPDISKHLIDGATLNRLSRGISVLLTTQKDGKEIYRSGNIIGLETFSIDELGMQKEFVDMIKYGCDTMKGDCGAPLIAQSDLLGKKLLGFHMAGGSGFGVVQPITAQEIDRCYKLHTQGTSESRLDYQIDELHKHASMNWKYVGHTPEMAASNTTSAIQPSILHNLFEVKTAPAQLRHPFAKNGPMIKGIQKYGGPTLPVDELILNQAVNSYSEILFERLPKPLEIEKRVLTTIEAIRGIEGNEHSSGVKRVKSAGYPWMFQTQGKPGKMHWLGSGADYDFSTPQFRMLNDRVNEIEQMCRNNIVPEAIFVDTLKDERRTLEKVLAGKTRVFAAAPMDYTIVQRKYFLGFLSYMTRTKIWNECGVGTNAHSRDWHNIVKHLVIGRLDQTMIAGDFSNFDGTLNYYILECIVEIINNFYGDHPTNKRVRKTLWRAISNCKHLFGNIVYQLNHSQPSGNAATAVINSMYNSLAVRYCYGLIKGEVHSFNKFVKMIAYGDDNIISVNPIIHKEFNPLTLANSFNTIGMVYTSEDKGKQSNNFRTIKEVTFLKRHFVTEGDYTFAPLSLDSIRESVMWIHKSPSAEQACVENVKMMLIELYHHGEDVFEDISYKIQSALSEKGISVTIHDYNRVRNLIKLEQAESVFDTYLAFQGERNFIIVPFDNNKLFKQNKFNPNNLLKIKYQSNMTKFDHHPAQTSSNSEGAQDHSSTVNNVKVGDYDNQGEITGSENAFTSEQTTTETQDTTTFVTYGAKETRDYVAPHDDNQVSDALRPSSEIQHSVESYLSRPVLIGSYSLNQDKIGDMIWNTPIMKTLSGITEFINKLQGFYGFRAKANFKVVANAQPFEFGLLNIFYVPFEQVKYDYNETLYKMGSLNLPFTTSCPNVIMNLNTQSEIVLSADYTGPNAFINLTNPKAQWGKFFVQVLTNPRNLNSNSVNIPLKFYLYFTDIELYGATSKSVATYQMDTILNAGKDLLGSVINGSNHPKMDSKQQGKESALASLGKTLLPLITVGLSKPPQNQAVERRTIQPFANPQLMDVTANVQKLSSLSSQAVNIAPMGVQPEDEMDILHIVSKPTYYDNVLWTTNDGDKKMLWRTPVEPNVKSTMASGSTVSKRYCPNRVHGVANLFDYWRGSMEYTFHIAATNFHSGRLCFVYTPSNDEIQNAYDKKHLNYYAVWDLRKGNTFKLVLPYIATTMWRPVPRFATHEGENLFGPRSLDGSFDDAPNTLFMYVENALKVPDASSQEMDIAVFVSAGKDFQVAAPCAVRNTVNLFQFNANNIPHAYLPSDAETKVEKGEAHYQSEDAPLDVPILNLVGGKNTMPNKAPISTSITMGEEISNLRTLLKRYRVVGSGKLKSGMYAIPPWAYYGGHIGGEDWHTMNYSYLDILRSCYLFYRGGMRMLFHIVSSDNSRVFATLKYRTESLTNGYDEKGTSIYTFTIGETNELGRNMIAGKIGWKGTPLSNPVFQATFPSSLSIPFIPELSGGVEIEAPYYARVHKTINYAYDLNDTVQNVIRDETIHLQPSGFIYLDIKSVTDTIVTTYRAAADDFNLGFFLGFPAHITNITFYEPVEADHWLPKTQSNPKELSDVVTMDGGTYLRNDANIGIIPREDREGHEGTAL